MLPIIGLNLLGFRAPELQHRASVKGLQTLDHHYHSHHSDLRLVRNVLVMVFAWTPLALCVSHWGMQETTKSFVCLEEAKGQPDTYIIIFRLVCLTKCGGRHKARMPKSSNVFPPRPGAEATGRSGIAPMRNNVRTCTLLATLYAFYTETYLHLW